MSAAAPLPLLGRIAVQLKMITQDQLAQATRKQAELGGAKNIGTVLCELGMLTQAQLAQGRRREATAILKALATGDDQWAEVARRLLAE